MTYIPDAMRRAVAERAKQWCEYCRIDQVGRYFTHEIDHVIAEKHGGETQLENLSLACSECNRFKGSDLCSLDTETNTIVPLFNPRSEIWRIHFQVTEGCHRSTDPHGTCYVTPFAVQSH